MGHLGPDSYGHGNEPEGVKITFCTPRFNLNTKNTHHCNATLWPRTSVRLEAFAVVFFRVPSSMQTRWETVQCQRIPVLSRFTGLEEVVLDTRPFTGRVKDQVTF